jgi:hypothetical protein
VVRVRGARYRGSQLIDGVFELVDSVPQRVRGEERYEVYGAWFGVKPFTKYPRIAVRPDACELIPSYAGEVIDNISAGWRLEMPRRPWSPLQLPGSPVDLAIPRGGTIMSGRRGEGGKVMVITLDAELEAALNERARQQGVAPELLDAVP